MANSVDRDQTAPIGAVCSGSTLIASILNSSAMLGNNLLQQTTFSDAFFLGVLRVNTFLASGNFLPVDNLCKQFGPRIQVCENSKC